MNLLCETATVAMVDGLTGRVAPGPGEKIFWMHGYTLDSSSWGAMWHRLPGWHHIGADFPGHGESPPIPQGMDLSTLGRRLGEYCRDEGVSHIVGLSFGTVAVLQIAIEFPDTFASVTLAAPAIAGGPQDESVQQAYTNLFINYQRGMRGVELKDMWMSCPAWAGVDQVPGLREALGSLVTRHRWTELESFAIRRVFEPPQLREDIAKICSPVLILTGEHEFPAYKTCASILQKTLQMSHCHVLADTSHLCLLQSPDAALEPMTEHFLGNARHAQSADG